MVVAAAAATLAGCGDRDRAPEPMPVATPAPLSAAERKTLRVYEGRIQAHCIRLAQSLTHPSAAPTPAQEADAFDAAEDLVAFARRKPLAPLDAGQDVRLYVSDVAENLEGSNCDPRLIAVLEQGLRGLPVE